MPYARANGIAIYYEVESRGPAVALVGGLGADGHFWHQQTPALARQFQMLLPDNRGAGRTDAPDEPCTIRMMADDLAGLLDELQMPPVHVVGASMGGMIAQEFALAYPARVRQLVLCCTSFGGPHSIPVSDAALPARTGDPRRDLRALFEVQLTPEYLQARARELDDYIAWRIEHPQSLHGYQRQAAALAAHDTEDRLGSLRLPVLILHGGRDNVIPTGNADLLAARIPGARVHIFADGGHLFLWECVDEANRVIADFLSGPSGNSAQPTMHHEEGLR